MKGASCFRKRHMSLSCSGRTRSILTNGQGFQHLKSGMRKVKQLIPPMLQLL